MKGILVIRKYKNRRLYDTEKSQHLTREQLLQTVREGRTVQVQEVATGEDVTVETLLQLIQSEEGLAASVLTPEFLHFLIRTDSGVLGRFFRDYLPLALRSFQASMASIESAQGQARQMAQAFPAFGPGFMGPWGGFPVGGMGIPAASQPLPEEVPEEESEDLDEVEELRRQLERMQGELVELQKRRSKDKKE